MNLNHKVSHILAFIIIAGGSFGLSSCNFFQGTGNDFEGREPLARVHDRYLFKEDIQELIPEGLSDRDSLLFMQNYINMWAKDQLMIYKAEYNLEESKKRFEKQIEQYRNDLLKFTYRQDYVRQNLDTVISDTAVERYYRNRADNLVLKENIVQGDYLVLDMNAPEMEKVEEWFRSNKREDMERLEDYALRYAYRFWLNDSSWKSMDDILEVLPVETDDQREFIRQHEMRVWDDSQNMYFLKIYEHRFAGEKPPLSYSRDLIKSILINKRKLKIIEVLERDLLKDAMRKKEFEVY